MNEELTELQDILEAIVANTSDSTQRLAESGLDIVELLKEELSRKLINNCPDGQ